MTFKRTNFVVDVFFVEVAKTIEKPVESSLEKRLGLQVNIFRIKIIVDVDVEVFVVVTEGSLAENNVPLSQNALSGDELRSIRRKSFKAQT